jgi:ATP-binding cassette subfamily B protein
MSEAANRQPEVSLARLAEAAWPSARAGEALYALARHAGLPVASVEAVALPATLEPEHLNGWIADTATRAALQADQAFVALDEIEHLISKSAPALIRLAALDDAPFLAVVRCRGKFVGALGPDLAIHQVRVTTISAAVRRPFEAPIEGAIDLVLGRMSLAGRSRSRARAAMIADRLKSVRFRGCWLLRLPPGGRLMDEAREAHFPRRLTALVGAHVSQYGMFILSWWLLGRGILSGTVDRGWLLGWLLLLASLIPLRLVATWNQGVAAVSIGAWLRRRLLRGAFMADRQEIRQKGGGQLFGLVMEAAAIDGLALTGGIFSAFALIELIVASIVLWAGAGAVAAPLLVGWAIVVSCLAWVYFQRRKSWTTERLGMTHHLLECMVGHRTRLTQQPEAEWHRHEDEALDRYIERGRTMDRSGLVLTALVPRGWLVLALVALIPSLVSDASAATLAISIGGILLAYRALQRLTAGLSNLTGAIIAGQSIASLAKSASRRESGPLASAMVAANPASDVARDVMVAQARDLTFRYRAQGEPVLEQCSLNIARNSHLLLEGPSGSGKTTFAAIVAGLQSAESGLLLMSGLDRAALGVGGWRKRVTMAPQAHDNYLVGGSLAFNLLMGGRWPAESSDLVEAETICRELGLGDLLDRLPAGLHQIIGETGWQLSQGERTRVFLARALLQRPELLVLDESFSALDAENVDRAMRCVTNRAQSVLAIAHT